MDRSVHIVVREACAADGGAIRAVCGRAVESLRRIYRPSPELVQSQAESVAPLQLVATLDGEVVGCISCMPAPGRLHLWGLMVDPRRQRCGVARAMLCAAADLARSRRLEHLSLCTVVQTGNVALFERLGFDVVREEPALRFESVSGEVLTEAFMQRPT